MQLYSITIKNQHYESKTKDNECRGMVHLRHLHNCQLDLDNLLNHQVDSVSIYLINIL